MNKNMAICIVAFLFSLNITFASSALSKTLRESWGSANIYLSPSSGRFTIGEEFWLDVMVDSGSEYVNAVAVYLSYPEEKLRATGIKRDGSIMTLFAEQESGNGAIKISGGRPTPGFMGVNKIASISFRATEGGDASIILDPNSAVLTNKDNRNILNYAQADNKFEYKIIEEKNVVVDLIGDIESRVANSFILPIILIVAALMGISLFGAFVLFVRSKVDKVSRKLQLEK